MVWTVPCTHSGRVWEYSPARTGRALGDCHALQRALGKAHDCLIRTITPLIARQDGAGEGARGDSPRRGGRCCVCGPSWKGTRRPDSAPFRPYPSVLAVRWFCYLPTLPTPLPPPPPPPPPTHPLPLPGAHLLTLRSQVCGIRTMAWADAPAKTIRARRGVVFATGGFGMDAVRILLAAVLDARARARMHQRGHSMRGLLHSIPVWRCTAASGPRSMRPKATWLVRRRFWNVAALPLNER
jgi:hypothetical protein